MNNGRKEVWLIRILLATITLFLWQAIPAGVLQAAPVDWHHVNDDGFGYPVTNWYTDLFLFDKKLYAYEGTKLFRMDNPICKIWKEVSTPGDKVPIPLGNYLYQSSLKGQLWWIKQGVDFTIANWKPVSSKGLPGGMSPTPMIVFNTYIYGVYYDEASSIFEIWRSKDIGKTVMNWKKVVSNSFGDPKNNKSVSFMAVFNNHIYAGTDSRDAGNSFGDPQGFGDGVEIWKSLTGDMGTWSQVNDDGFGTELTHKGKKLRTNQEIGSWAVYKAPKQAQEYLYVGTLSHWGAEVWRYDGKGKGGWKNVTPPWAGPNKLWADVKRFISMTAFQHILYVAEGYPSGSLSKYDGKKWSVVVGGPKPFNPDNNGLGYLAVFDNALYVSTIKKGMAKSGNQVWGYPFTVWKFACVDLFWRRFSFTMIDPGLIELGATLTNSGPEAIDKQCLISAYLDDELIYNEKHLSLGPDEKAEIVFSHAISEGDHELTLIADAENQIDETYEENNVFSFSFSVSPEEAPDRNLLNILFIFVIIALTVLIMRRFGFRRRK